MKIQRTKKLDGLLTYADDFNQWQPSFGELHDLSHPDLITANHTTLRIDVEKALKHVGIFRRSSKKRQNFEFQSRFDDSTVFYRASKKRRKKR